ncbi:MAG: sigma-70 family RNA polymerase sigma factor [Gammaproteobacteria bacterium]|nr:sigma-70 family RNA polymerase sigma factor [Gammaproteobacteria bacterium]
MGELTDEELFRRFAGGDFEAFQDLYARYRKSLYLYLLRSSSSATEADDLYQEAWARVIQSKGRFTGGSFKAWVFRIARNLQIDSFRRQRITLIPEPDEPGHQPDPGPTPDDISHYDDCRERLKLGLQSLSQEQREAFLLKEESGLTLEQIAGMLGVGRETLKSRIRYALKRLRQLLEDCV